LPTPTNRWTSYDSPSESDWLEIDFGKPVEFRRVELGIYDDRGGVQPPAGLALEVWQNDQWRTIDGCEFSPRAPAGSQWNTVRFPATTGSKLRMVFTHQGKARSGVTEVMVWNE
jgi:hypothetical protein